MINLPANCIMKALKPNFAWNIQSEPQPLFLFRSCGEAWEITLSKDCRVLVGVFAEKRPSQNGLLKFWTGSSLLMLLPLPLTHSNANKIQHGMISSHKLHEFSFIKADFNSGSFFHSYVAGSNPSWGLLTSFQKGRNRFPQLPECLQILFWQLLFFLNWR